MNAFKLICISLLLLPPALAIASSGKKPMSKTADVTGVSGRATPTYIAIKSMANPAIYYSRNNADLNVTVTGSAQAQDEAGLDELLGDTNVTQLDDGGLEIDIRTQGVYNCDFFAFNNKIHKISGECLQRIDVNFKAGPDVPLYLNGQFIKLN